MDGNGSSAQASLLQVFLTVTKHLDWSRADPDVHVALENQNRLQWGLWFGLQRCIYEAKSKTALKSLCILSGHKIWNEKRDRSQ